MKFLVILSFLFIFSRCASNEFDASDPKEFYSYIIKVAKDGDKEEWVSNVMSTEYKSKKDQKGIDKHWEAWSKELFKINENLDTIKVTYDEVSKTIQINDDSRLMFHVVREGGLFKINEN
jgi:hypothetical protein